MGRFCCSLVLGWVGLAAVVVGCSSTTTKQEAPLPDGGAGSSGETGGAGSSGETGGTGGSDEASCATYCDALEANCTGEFAQFVSRTTCLEYCKLLPVGSSSDEIGNTMHCRLNQAELAGNTAEPGQHCAEAGPGGHGICGSNCEAYCVVLEQACEPVFQDEFLGRPDCNSKCGEIPDVERFQTGIDSGNSVQCRLWHLSAATLDPSTHCGHAVGEAPCNAHSSGTAGAGGI
jgi:hypothetical protein